MRADNPTCALEIYLAAMPSMQLELPASEKHHNPDMFETEHFGMPDGTPMTLESAAAYFAEGQKPEKEEKQHDNHFDPDTNLEEDSVESDTCFIEAEVVQESTDEYPEFSYEDFLSSDESDDEKNCPDPAATQPLFASPASSVDLPENDDKPCLDDSWFAKSDNKEDITLLENTDAEAETTPYVAPLSPTAVLKPSIPDIEPDIEEAPEPEELPSGVSPPKTEKGSGLRYTLLLGIFVVTGLAGGAIAASLAGVV